LRTSPARGNIYMLVLFVWDISCQTALGFAARTAAFGRLAGSPWIYVVSETLIFGLPFAGYLIVTRSGFSGALPAGRLGLGSAALIVLMCLLLSPVMMLISGVTSMVFGVENAADRILAAFSGEPPALSVLALAVMPAVFEELTFRGIILTNHAGLGIRAAALLNGLFFGIIHMNLQQFPYAFAVGAVFSLFVLRSGSILASVLAHFCMNGSQLLLNACPRLTARLIPVVGGEPGPPVGLMVLCGAAAAAGAGFILVYRVFKLYSINCHPERSEGPFKT